MLGGGRAGYSWPIVSPPGGTLPILTYPQEFSTIRANRRVWRIGILSPVVSVPRPSGVCLKHSVSSPSHRGETGIVGLPTFWERGKVPLHILSILPNTSIFPMPFSLKIRNIRGQEYLCFVTFVLVGIGKVFCLGVSAGGCT